MAASFLLYRCLFSSAFCNQFPYSVAECLVFNKVFKADIYPEPPLIMRVRRVVYPFAFEISVPVFGFYGKPVLQREKRQSCFLLQAPLSLFLDTPLPAHPSVPLCRPSSRATYVMFRCRECLSCRHSDRGICPVLPNRPPGCLGIIRTPMREYADSACIRSQDWRAFPNPRRRQAYWWQL